MSLVANLLMLVGALTWLGGEILGVVRNRSKPAPNPPDTTSGWVWLLERKWAWTRMLVAAGLAALAVHFLLP